MEKSSFFGNFYGSISGLSFYAKVPQHRHPLVLLHVVVLAALVLAAALTPFVRRVAAVGDRLVSLYDERFPEIHLAGNHVRFVGTIPTEVQLADGRQVVVDTSGAYLSAEGMAPGSVLVTNRFLEVKTNQGLRRLLFDSLNATPGVVITPKNARALKDQVLVAMVALLAVSGLAAFSLVGLVVCLLGAGWVLFLCRRTRTPLRPRDAFALAAYGLTPPALVLGAVLLAKVSSGPFVALLWAGYCFLLVLVVLRIRGAVGVHAA
ncbi:MAG: DUF1189 family protein [candidate division KSB1 bacterium]|nr:DUF1189 family protein [candidate division KSB1 bacterium]